MHIPTVVSSSFVSYALVLLLSALFPNPAWSESNAVTAPSSSVTAGLALELYRPRFPDSAAAHVNLDQIGESVVITFLYKPMTVGDVVTLNWKGTSDYQVPEQVVAVPGVPMVFQIPSSVVAGDDGGGAVVTASVKTGTQPEVTSPAFDVTVGREGSSTGDGIAQRLNARFNATENACPGNLPAYYCNGIIVRSVDNGDFDPWDPSPSGERLGAISFSYFRVDTHTDNLYRKSGFIFLPQSEAIAQGKAVNYLCIYAYDAGTLVGTRPDKGCGLKQERVSDDDLSTCAGKNATTVEGWYAFTKSLAHRDYQCSLSTRKADQFAVSYQVRANKPDNMNAAWNELMVELWPQGHGAQLPIEAFYYRARDVRSLEDARTFQYKFHARTGLWVPVVAFDLDRLEQSPFSYHVEDQRVAQVPAPEIKGVGSSGVLELSSLGTQPVDVYVDYPGMAEGHRITLQWSNAQKSWTESKVVGKDHRGLSFAVPHDVARAALDGQVLVTASVTRWPDERVIVSPSARLAVKKARTGRDVAQALNQRFVDTRDSCRAGTPAYYCNGLLIRAIDDGDFMPWNPSPRAEKLGAVSLSWLRRGTHVTRLHTASGFIFLPQQLAIEKGFDLRYLCVYAYDAWTALEGRPANGCGLQPSNRSAADLDLSTCASQQATTVTGWYAFTRTIENSKYQCSLSTRDAGQFAVAYKVRDKRPPNIVDTYNEVLVATWPQDIPDQLPMEAFFYTSSQGREAAMNFQRKFKQSTDGWLPVVKVDLRRLSTSTPMSYLEEDQAVLP